MHPLHSTAITLKPQTGGVNKIAYHITVVGYIRQVINHVFLYIMYCTWHVRITYLGKKWHQNGKSVMSYWETSVADQIQPLMPTIVHSLMTVTG